MEFYNFYQLSYLISSFFTEDEKIFITLGVIIGAALWLGFFFLQGAGLFVMAKRRGLTRRWLAFVPFANIYYMGKIAGKCDFFGHKMTNAGLYAMIAQILASTTAILAVLSEWYLNYNYGVPVLTEMGSASWLGLSGFSQTVNKCYEVSTILFSLTGLVAEILIVILLIGLFKKYSPRNYRLLAVLSFFIPATRFIAVFVLRNNEEIDYEAYMRRMREAYVRRQQQYYNGYGNPYGGNYDNPYGNPYGGYSQDGGMQNGQAPTLPPEEPFEEFSTADGKNFEKGKEDDPDDFFN